MLSCTLREYKKSYNSRFLTYEKKYKDNTLKTFFLKELEVYKAYHQALVNLKELILPYFEDDSIPVEVDSHLISYLKSINEGAYNKFVTDYKFTEHGIIEDGEFKELKSPVNSSEVDFNELENLITSSIGIVDFIKDKINTTSLTSNTKEEFDPDLGENKTIENNNIIVDNYKSFIWFKVGLLFAEGKLNKYYNNTKTGFKEGFSAPKVSKELGFNSYEKYILASINNYSNSNKNIFNFRHKMDKVVKHCNELQIKIDDFFLSKLPKE